MADMNKRHHRLIEDAVVEGIVKSFSDAIVAEMLHDAIHLEMILTHVARKVASELSSRLQYTNDNFNAIESDRFNQSVVDRSVKAMRHIRVNQNKD